MRFPPKNQLAVFGVPESSGFCLILFTLFSVVTVSNGQLATAQQASDGRPLEYIESSSPLPGGGTVTSIQYPGQQPSSLESLRETAGRQVAGTGQAERSVLVQNPATVGANQQTIAPAPINYQYAAQPVTTVPLVAGTRQVPNLGVPTAWNRSFRSGCGNCAGGTGVYAPANLTGVQAPAASLPPALPMAPQTAFLPARSQATAAPVQVQNLPPNSWVGRGIVGSPKLYVDGQPVRNLFRFIVP